MMEIRVKMPSGYPDWWHGGKYVYFNIRLKATCRFIASTRVIESWSAWAT
jgi:hypothetical protein